MKRLLALLLLALPAVSWGAEAQPREDTVELAGAKRAYYVYAPEPKGLPSQALLLVLHDRHGSAEQMVRAWLPVAEAQRFVVAGPQARDVRDWRFGTDGPELLHAIAEQLKREHPIDPKRVYLFGHGAGANFALSVALLESEFYAAVATYAGVWRNEAELAAMEQARRKLPIAIFSGVDDALLPPQQRTLTLTEQSLKKRGFPVSVTVLRGLGETRGFPEKLAGPAWEFLRGHELDREPYHAKYRFPDTTP